VRSALPLCSPPPALSPLRTLLQRSQGSAQWRQVTLGGWLLSDGALGRGLGGPSGRGLPAAWAVSEIGPLRRCLQHRAMRRFLASYLNRAVTAVTSESCRQVIRPGGRNQRVVPFCGFTSPRLLQMHEAISHPLGTFKGLPRHAAVHCSDKLGHRRDEHPASTQERVRTISIFTWGIQALRFPRGRSSPVRHHPSRRCGPIRGRRYLPRIPLTPHVRNTRSHVPVAQAFPQRR
jgi:hypothetical protein